MDFHRKLPFVGQKAAIGQPEVGGLKCLVLRIGSINHAHEQPTISIPTIAAAAAAHSPRVGFGRR